MRSRHTWLWIVMSAALIVAVFLTLRASLRPCAWLDRTLGRSGCLATVADLDGAVAAVAVSPDGSLIAASSQYGEVTLWRAVDNSQVRTLMPSMVSRRLAYTYDVVFSPDGSRVALGQPDGSVQLWRLPDGEPIQRLEGAKGAIFSLAFSLDGQSVFAGTDDGAVQVWHLPDGVPADALINHEDGVVSLALSPDGTSLASASLDGTITLWRTKDGAILSEAESSPVPTGVAFSPDGALLVANRRLLRVPDLAPVRELSPSQGGMGNVVFSPDGRLVAAGNARYEVRWWRVSDGTLARTVRGHSDSVNSVAYAPDGATLVSGSLDGTVRLWEAPEG